jgi:hypothetical protein
MSAAEPPPTDPTIPRVLLFGHRGAGKSALIGALLKAGETQGDVLRGEVVHSSVDLPRIRDAVYSGGKLDPQTAELVSYTVKLKPWRVGPKPVGPAMTVTLDDCDGKAAEALLEHPEPITRRAPDSPVAKAVVDADAIVLLVDAASTDEELNEAFVEFDRFLKTVGRAKTDARAVGGFPIYMVLTQCDRLAQPGDSRRMWEVRVGDRVENAEKKFAEYLKEARDAEDEGAPSPFLAFGSVEFEVFAAAVRAPALPDAPNPGDTPFKVAELFRDCFAAARAHNDRVQASNVRLKWTLRLAAAALLSLLTGLTAVTLFPPRNDGPTLAERVREYLAGEPAAAERLSDANIERNRATLAAFRSDRAFGGLDPELQQSVDNRLKEIADYKDYRKRLAATPPPASARSKADLDAASNVLKGELVVPVEYNWTTTAAGQLYAKWVEDCAAIEEAQKAMVEQYRAREAEAANLMLPRAFDSAWLGAIDSLTARGDQPPFPLNAELPNTRSVPQPGGERVAYRVPYEFDEVYQVRRYWEQTRDKLAHLRNLADAVGATTAPDRPPAVLVLPEPDGNDSVTLAGARLAALRRTYPRPSDGYDEWELQHFRDPARSELAARLAKSFDAGARHVRKLLNPENSVAGWKAAAARLDEPAFRDWGQLLHLLARLQEPTAPNPVTEMASFLLALDAKTYDIDVPAFDLVVPLELTVGFERVVPAGPFTITLARGQEPPVTVKYAVGAGATRDKTTVYRLTREGDAKLAYRAGDDLRAELPVEAGRQALRLVWEAGGSNTFRFDRLSHEPRLTRAGGGTDAAPGVKLVPSAASAFPKLPVLMSAR